MDSPADRTDAPAPPPPLPAEQILAGLGAALALGILDSFWAAASEGADALSLGEQLLGSLHLVALVTPLGFVFAAASTALFALVRTAPLLAPLRTRIRRPRDLFRNDPRLFGGALSIVLAALALLLVGREAHGLIATRVHHLDNAAWAAGGAAVGGAAAALVVSLVAFAGLRRVTRWLGPLGSLGALLVVGLVAGAAIARFVLVRNPAIITAYGAGALAWGPTALAVFVAAALIARRALRGRPARRAWIAAALAGGATLAAWVTSGLTYGDSNRVRAFVEHGSVAGTPLVRRYGGLTDMDGDGHAWAFGGRDCDDFDARVHPGAYDREGDGVDADCFAGDGSPDLADLGDGHYGERPRGLPARPNILLITVDALNPTHLSHMGYARDTSPNLDRFAEEAVVFENVVAQSSRSLRSIPAMMTGRYPSQVAYGPEYLWPSLLEENRMLPEMLKDRGYVTAVDMGTDYFHRVAGFFQGYDQVQELPVYTPRREDVIENALERLPALAAGEAPFFHWVHVFNVHEPYLRPPAPSRYGDTLRDHYDTEIRLADALVQRLLDRAEELSLMDDTVVILASDHGEAFYEHGRRGHASDLYEEQVRAMLMMKIPGVEPRRVQARAGLFDLTPTILNLVSIPVPQPMPARSLLPLIDGGRHDDRLLFSELMPDGLYPFDQKALYRGDRKLLWWVQEGRIQLFDLAADPAEERDLSDDDRDEAEEMLGLLQAWVAQVARGENRTDAFVEQNRLSAPPSSLTHPMNLVYPGMFTVLGCDLPSETYRPREVIDLTCYYEVDDAIEDDLFIRVTFDGPAGYRVPPHFHAWHYPLHGRYRTTRWQEGEILRDPMPMVVPPDIQAPVELEMTFMVQISERAERNPNTILAYRQDGRAGSVAQIARIRIAPSER
ncbi:MAG: sulfatase-like hydrolase/transferase [Myxococcota bacterium]|nr:sulfatase-like hydrolase/transferase [Myxococcota bacterium]